MKQYFDHKAAGYRWHDIPLLAYKEEGTHFKSITRQTLWDSDRGFASQLRYFEIAPGGHSTLERHAHVHGVMVLRGHGRALVGKQVLSLAPFDLVYVSSKTWHQFRADDHEALGFLCLVNVERDRPERPDAAAIEAMRKIQAVSDFIRL